MIMALANACGPVPVDEAVADGDGGDDGDDGAGAGGDYRGDDGDDDAYCALPEWRKEAYERQTLFMAALRADKKGALLSSLFSFYVKKDRAVDPPVDRCPRGARGVDGRGPAPDETGAGRGCEKKGAARRRRSVS